jgi:hypothetical protein
VAVALVSALSLYYYKQSKFIIINADEVQLAADHAETREPKPPRQSIQIHFAHEPLKAEPEACTTPLSKQLPSIQASEAPHSKNLTIQKKQQSVLIF